MKNLAKWAGDFVALLVSVFFILIVAVVLAWPAGFLIKSAHKLYLFGYHLWN